MSTGFRRGRPERPSGGKIVLSFLPSVPDSMTGSGSASGSNGETVTTTRATTRYCTKSDNTLVQLTTDSPCVESTGLSVQSAGTNLAVRSQELDNTTPWAHYGSPTSGNVTSNTTTAPDGSLTADTLILPAIAAAQYAGISKSQTWTNVAHAMSVYAKGVSGSGTFYTSLVDPAWHGAANDYNAATWTRFVFKYTPAAGAQFFQFGVDTRDTNTPQNVQSAQNVYVWGAQIETADFARRYTPTVAATATTNADSITMSSAALPTTKGRLEVDVTPLWSTVTAAYVLDTRSGVGASGIALYVETTSLKFQINALTALASAALTWTPGTTYRLKVVWGNGNVSVYRDGTSVASITDGSATMPSAHTTLRLGAKYDSSAFLDGNLKRLLFYR